MTGSVLKLHWHVVCAEPTARMGFRGPLTSVGMWFVRLQFRRLARRFRVVASVGAPRVSAKSSVCTVLVAGCYVKAPSHRLYGAGCLNMIHNILAPLGFMGRMLKSKSRISSVVVGRVGLGASCGLMRNVVVCVGCLEFGLCSREAIRYDIDWCGDYIQSSGCGSPCIGFDPMEEANLLTASLHLQYK